MVVDGVIVHMPAGIGLVVATADAIRLAQVFYQGQGNARILVPHDAHMPAPDHLGEYRGTGVHGNQRRHRSVRVEFPQPCCNRIVVGMKE